jgi:hypothetical protein
VLYRGLNREALPRWQLKNHQAAPFTASKCVEVFEGEPNAVAQFADILGIFIYVPSSPFPGLCLSVHARLILAVPWGLRVSASSR